MNKNCIVIIFLAIATLIITGCNAGLAKQAQDLRTEAISYGKLIRWRAYDDAKNYTQPRDGAKVALDYQLLNEIRVTRYEVTAINLSEAKDEAVVIAEISYYHERVNKVHDITDEQIWWKDSDSGRWLVDGGLPNFTP